MGTKVVNPNGICKRSTYAQAGHSARQSHEFNIALLTSPWQHSSALPVGFWRVVRAGIGVTPCAVNLTRVSEQRSASTQAGVCPWGHEAKCFIRQCPGLSIKP
jgi:hypothetical protein